MYPLCKLTILPSPLPKSMSLPDRPARADITFLICVAVAGTYGRQKRRRAGETKGRHITLSVTAAPPATEFQRAVQVTINNSASIAIMLHAG